MTALQELKELLGEVSDLERAAAVLSWDQETYMPPGGVEDRAAQLSTLAGLAHARFTAAAVGELLERAAAETAGLDYDSDEASLVRVTRRDWEQEIKLPPELVTEMARAGSISRQVWQEARRAGDWALFAPRMELTVDLARRQAEALGYEGRPLDALIAREEPGLTTDAVEAVFARLREAIVPLVGALGERSGAVDDSVLDRDYDPERQVGFALLLIEKLGYDLRRGRQDLSAHPFSTSFGPGDVRVTTRVKRNLRDSCIFSSIHESGHAMYSQGTPRSLDRTPLWGGASSGVHESQSRLWENLVGRGRPFWEHFFPALRETFPEQLADQDAETFFRAGNKVQPSYIRVDADEATYNLHIMLRTEIENDLLEGRLQVADVPERWNAKIRDYLGLAPPPVADGPLQDVHWSFPTLGTFVGYTLGNVISAQLMESIRRDLPDLDDLTRRGEFAPLLDWLRRHVHAHGRKFTPDELLVRATGRPLTPEPWIAYVRTKFGELYGLD